MPCASGQQLDRISQRLRRPQPAPIRVVADFLEGLLTWGLEGEEDRTCILVGHSSLNRVLLATVMSVPLNDYRRRFEQDWASLTVLRWESREEGPKLLLANDQSHSKGVRGNTWD